MGGVHGGGQPQGGYPTQAGNPTQSSGGSPAPSGNLSSGESTDLNNLIADASGNNGAGIASHVPKDLTSLRWDVQNAVKDGQMSEQAGAKAIEDITSGNIQGVEQDLTGTSGPVSSDAQGYISK